MKPESKPTAQPDLSIVIVGYNSRDLLLDCLASIFAAPLDRSIEVIVVDNASKDGTAQAVAQNFPQVQLIANAYNNYFSAGNNQGIESARGRYVVALNPDMLVKGRTLSQLVQQMESDPSIGAATTTTLFPDGRLQRNGARFVTFGYLLFNYTFLGKLFPSQLARLNDWLWYSDWDRTTPQDVDILPGCCIIAQKTLWQQLGGFDSRLPMYFSDDYLSRAVRATGKRT